MNFLSRSLLALATALPIAAYAGTTIGVSMAHFDDNFLTTVRESMASEGKAKNVSLDFEDAQGDVGRQVSQVEAFVAQHVAAIIVNPADASATKRMTDAARKAGIPIVYVNRKPDEPLGNGAYFVGSDSLVAGHLQMEYLAKKLNGHGNIALMLGELSTDATRDRTRGVKDIVAKNPGIHVVAEQTANFDRSQAINLMSQWLSAGKKFDAIAANNDEMALGALIAMRQAGVSPKAVLVGGVDATKDALFAMSKGDLAVTVFQDGKGQGKAAVDMAAKLAGGDKSVQSEAWIPYQLVTPENYKGFVNR
ncbi:sugar ABC transporter substrate-binding protein [Paraburkholderia pallida]|uniref:Sugar ABC transporter substrate-binding protein n=1 Tax=Paraburkholderia pallida TaxID=2547399 RepID=A0A4P7CZE9_9BURK|nr:sugar ABC transporter substrate-binding protein [Paraburkholderia pallida]QBR01729.1 sugar ABC transporter substrate-binding protein [Paraburkholderia pallida]